MEETKTTTTSETTETGTATEQQQTAENAAAQAAQTEPKMVSAEDHQKAMTKQYAAGIAAAMKKAGFEPDKSEDFETQMKAFRDWQDSQKTEAQKAIDAKTELENSLNAEKKKSAALSRQIQAIGKGIPADKSEQYIVLAQSYMDDDTDFEKALDLALINFPVEKKDVPPPYAAGTGTQTTQSEPTGEFEKRMAKYRR